MKVDTPIINEEIVNKTKRKMISEKEIYEISDFPSFAPLDTK